MNVYANIGKYDNPLNYYQKTNKLLLNNYGYKSNYIARWLNDVGNVIHQQGNYHKALKYVYRLLDTRHSCILWHLNHPYWIK